MGASFYILFNERDLPITQIDKLPDNVSAIFIKDNTPGTYFSGITELPRVFVTKDVDRFDENTKISEVLRLLNQVTTKYVFIGYLTRGFFSPECEEIITRFKTTNKKILFGGHRRPFYTNDWVNEAPRYLWQIDTVVNRDLLGEDLFLLPMHSFGETEYMTDMYKRIEKSVELSIDIPIEFRGQVAIRRVFDKDQENIGIDNTHRVFSLLEDKELIIKDNGIIKASWSGGFGVGKTIPIWMRRKNKNEKID